MANSAADARASEQDIREKLIRSGDVDALVSIGPNFFYTVTLPCTLWFFDKGKAGTPREDTVLFIDARHIYRQLDRAHRDFTPAQIEFLANIVRLYRGEAPEFAHGSESQLAECFATDEGTELMAAEPPADYGKPPHPPSAINHSAIRIPRCRGLVQSRHPQRNRGPGLVPQSRPLRRRRQRRGTQRRGFQGEARRPQRGVGGAQRRGAGAGGANRRERGGDFGGSMRNDGWKECRLGDVINLKRGYDLPTQKRIPGGVPILSSSGISDYHNKAKVKGPGVVTGRYGTLGEVFYIEEDYWPLNTSLYVQNFKGNYPRFVSYFLKTLHFGSQNAAGAVPGVNRNHLHELQVKVPDLPTQTKIAGILSAYDDLIENNLRRIKILEEMAQSLYREWFVHFRIPAEVLTKAGLPPEIKLVDSPMGRIPEGWEVKKLGELAAINGETIRQKCAPNQINYIDIASVSTGSVDKVEPMLFADAPSRARRIVRHGDVIWSTVRPNRRSFALILDPSENLVVSTGFAVLSPREIPSSYLYHAVTTEDFTGYLINHATGAAYPAVNASIFSEADLLLPPTTLLEKFDATAGQCLTLRANLQGRNETLSRTRKLLLPKLLAPKLY